MKTGWRRVVRWVLIGLAGLLAAVMALALIALAVVSSPAADEPLRRFVSRKANEALQGTVSFQSLRLRGNHLVLQGIALKDPDGEVIGQIAEVETRVSLGHLVRKTLDISELTIREPHFEIRQGASGTNLSRALSPRTLKSPSPESSPSTLRITLERLHVVGGSVAVTSAGGDHLVHLSQLDLAGNLGLIGSAIDGQLLVTALLQAPVQAPVKLEIVASTEGPRQLATVSLAAMESALDVQVAMRSAQDIHVDLKQLLVSPDLIRALDPKTRMLMAARIAGEASLVGTSATADLRIDSGAAQGRLKGQVDVTSFRSDGVQLDLEHVNVAELLNDGPASELNLRAVVSGGGRELQSMDADVDLNVFDSTLLGQSIGPLHLKADAHQGRYRLLDFIADLPGIFVKAGGSVDSTQVDLKGTIDIAELRTVAIAVRKIMGTADLGVSGKGRLSFSVLGSRKHPAVALKGDFPYLRYQDKRVEQLSLEASVPELPKPAGAHLRLRASRATVAPGRVLQRVAVDLNSDGPDLVLRASVEGKFPTSLGARVALKLPQIAGNLKELELRYPTGDWILASPTAFSFADGAASMGKLLLTSGAQSIALQGSFDENVVNANAALTRIDLQELPTTLFRPDLKLGGTLTTSAHVSGKLTRPNVEASLELKNGSWTRYSNVSAKLDLALARDIARGTMDIHGEGIEVQSRFELPLQELLRGGTQPLKLTVRIPELQLGPALRELGVRGPGSGSFAAELDVSGTSSAPSVRFDAAARKLRFQQLPESNVHLLVTGTPRDPLRARAELEIRNQKSFVELETRYSIRQLVQHPPTPADLMRAPLTVRAEVHAFPLPWLYTSGLVDAALLGVLDANADLRGSVLSPHGELRITARGVSTSDIPPTNAELAAFATEREVKTQINISQNAKSVVHLEAAVEAPPSRLMSLNELLSSPLSLKAEMGPIALAQIQTMTRDPNADPNDAAPPLNGSFAAKLVAHGSLASPEVNAELQVSGLGTKGSATGDIQATYQYHSTQHALHATVSSMAGGTLDLTASTKLDVSYPAVRAVRVGQIPIAAQVHAKDLNLSFLSGVGGFTVQVGGLLRANATIEGTMPTPALRGDLDWSKGLLSTHGSGEFRNIHVALSGDNEHLKLTELKAESGRGDAKVSMEAVKAGQKWTVHAEAALGRFPVMSDGQLMATLWTHATVKGDFESSRISLNPVHISDARVELPDVQRKDLQKLDSPTDIVLLRRGKPVRSNAVKKPAGQGVGGAGSAPSPLQIAALIDAPRNLWIEANDVNVEIGLSDGFRVAYDGTPGIFGDVQVVRGRIAVFGRDFDVDRDSKAHFAGAPLKPDLNVGATYINETEQVKVHVAVIGSPENATVNATSTPPLPETEIYTLLATGRLSLHSGTGTTSPQGQAASILGSLAATQLKKTIASHVPLDVLSIEAGDNGLTGTKVRAGTYVNDKLYLGFTGRIGADPLKGENSNQVDLEYQLSKHWSVQGDYGDAKAGAANLIWSKEY